LLQEKSVTKSSELKRNTLFKEIEKTLKKDIIQQYRDVSDEILEDPQNAQINSEELLRIHYYFEEIWIRDILNDLSSLIGEFKGKKSKSLKV